MDDTEVDPDIVAQVRADFPAEDVAAILQQLSSASGSQRIRRCIAFAARGHRSYFEYLCRLAKVDYRDVIMAAEYDRLNVRLYDFNQPISQAQIKSPFASNDDGPNVA